MLELIGEWDEAVVELRESIRLQPEDPLGYYALAVSLKTMRRWREAAEAFRDYLDIVQSDPVNHDQRRVKRVEAFLRELTKKQLV